MLYCVQCGHTWLVRDTKAAAPKRCPNCHTRNWSNPNAPTPKRTPSSSVPTPPVSDLDSLTPTSVLTEAQKAEITAMLATPPDELARRFGRAFSAPNDGPTQEELDAEERELAERAVKAKGYATRAAALQAEMEAEARERAGTPPVSAPTDLSPVDSTTTPTDSSVSPSETTAAPNAVPEIDPWSNAPSEPTDAERTEAYAHAFFARNPDAARAYAVRSEAGGAGVTPYPEEWSALPPVFPVQAELTDEGTLMLFNLWSRDRWKMLDELAEFFAVPPVVVWRALRDLDLIPDEYRGERITVEWMLTDCASVRAEFSAAKRRLARERRDLGLPVDVPREVWELRFTDAQREDIPFSAYVRLPVGVRLPARQGEPSATTPTPASTPSSVATPPTLTHA